MLRENSSALKEDTVGLGEDDDGFGQTNAKLDQEEFLAELNCLSASGARTASAIASAPGSCFIRTVIARNGQTVHHREVRQRG